MYERRLQCIEGMRIYLILSFAAYLLVYIVELFWLDVPYRLFELWRPHGNAFEWLLVTLPLIAWGVSITAWKAITTKNDPRVNIQAERVLVEYFILSLWAGVVEEVCFRWLLFLGGIVVLTAVDGFFYMVLGFGLLQPLQEYVLGPVANFLTLGCLDVHLTDPNRWAVGLSMLISNGFFRAGHDYHGWFGTISSWFVGMYLFGICLTYGLPAAIVTHVYYDLLIFGVVYLDMVFERSRYCDKN